jgi:hypothetical protein
MEMGLIDAGNWLYWGKMNRVRWVTLDLPMEVQIFRPQPYIP